MRKGTTGNNEAIDAAIGRLLAANQLRVQPATAQGKDGRKIRREVLGPVGKLRLSAAPDDSGPVLPQPATGAEEGG